MIESPESRFARGGVPVALPEQGLVTGADVALAPVPEPNAVAAVVFGARLPLARRYAELLAGDGARRGLIGPREAPRLWDRHLVNCAVVAAAFPLDARVVDVGSGAGLPGLVLACLRADLRIDLVDSLHRRTRFLTEAVELLELGERVRVITGRAEEPRVIEQVGRANWVTARAVAPLARLAGWCLPLLVPGGTLVAVKGETAQRELAQAGTELTKLGVRNASVREYGWGVVAEPARAVLVVRR